jgi:hypothetical protein
MLGEGAEFEFRLLRRCILWMSARGFVLCVGRWLMKAMPGPLLEALKFLHDLSEAGFQ